MTDPDTSPIFRTIGSGAWRGAKFGALVGFVIVVVIQLGALIFVLLNPIARAHIFDGHPTVLSMIGSTVAGIGLVMLYGALAGAVVMGVASIFRHRSG
jgi:hypothetical protein